MDYTKLLEKTGTDLFNKGYSCYIGEGVLVSMSNSDFDNDFTLVIENNEGMSTLDYGEKDYIFTSYYIAVCMAEKKVSFNNIEKTFADDMYRETFTNRVKKWLKPRELAAIEGHKVFLARKTYYEENKEKRMQYYQDHREEILEWGKQYYKKNKKKYSEYGKEYRRKKKEAA